ncbi:MAG: hypothetical protein J0M08_12100 [Bacteroidetes bacterium]|nr:hypothetical protein [Bacteroidota bacterium]
MADFYFIAGPNGAGKSTNIEYLKNLGVVPANNFHINTDKILSEEFSRFEKNNDLLVQVNAYVGNIERQLQADKANYSKETNFHKQEQISECFRLKNFGYNVNLVYVNIGDPDLCSVRVNQRVKQGGHFVDPITVKDRYEKGLSNIISHYKKFDNVYVLNNSQKPEVLFKVEQNQLIKIAEKLPQWSEKLFKEIELRENMYKRKGFSL